MTGVCKTCKLLKKEIHAQRNENSLQEKMEELRIHLRDAVGQRALYKERVEEAIKSWIDDVDSDRLSVGCIAFDYAASCHLPSIVREAQGDWMANQFGLEMRIFGVTNEGAKEYNAYFYDETFNHVDTESVISLLERFFSTHERIASARTLYAYSDSCSGQNRNNFMVAYLVIRVLDGYHERISWNFLIVGHTKFSPDQLFGLLKSIFNRYDVIVPDELVHHAINNITIGNRARSKGYTINAEHITEEDQVFRHWKELVGLFRRFDGIKKKPIAEVRFDAIEVEGQRQVEVSYRLVNEESWTVLTILKRQAVWPRPGGLSDLSRLPSLVPWKKVKYKRHVNLNKYVRELSSPPTPEQLSYYANIPHCPPRPRQRPANRDRGGRQLQDELPSPEASDAEPEPESEDDMEELEEGFVNPSGVTGDIQVLQEAAKDDIVPEPSAEKRPRSPSPPPRTPSPPPPAPTPAVATPSPSRARIMAALAPTSYDQSSRWNRSVPRPGAKRARKMTKHDDFED